MASQLLPLGKHPDPNAYPGLATNRGDRINRQNSAEPYLGLMIMLIWSLRMSQNCMDTHSAFLHRRFSY
ncbi:conserved hypothetical protein [Uncinocarpus reesii 1704]|uniref:Uncharacterized protein n=1 Tax=Uncinocarpus reesii (strain UAMH 1704) TaxID=336963 RepID=C4K007_UNCRE|nr:uncharacterized protein UREG_07758 [Uncinocarpus reesii 1704]EEP82893.1 conserved hypothetical protein [Uncinocarpus reesii 1704]